MAAVAASLLRAPPAIYPITDRTLGAASHAELTRALVRGGAAWVQVRDKGMAGVALLAAVRAALVEARAGGAKLIVNDRLDVALAAGADGVHLGDEDLPVAAARRLAGAEFLIGTSTHDVEQALRAQELPCDYVALGPVFATSSKKDARPALGLEALRRVRAGSAKPLVAIGGITRDRLPEVLAAGADSVALIAAVMVPGEVENCMVELLRLAAIVRG